jgi:hypothetical protein
MMMTTTTEAMMAAAVVATTIEMQGSEFVYLGLPFPVLEYSRFHMSFSAACPAGS